MPIKGLLIRFMNAYRLSGIPEMESTSDSLIILFPNWKGTATELRYAIEIDKSQFAGKTFLQRLIHALEGEDFTIHNAIYAAKDGKGLVKLSTKPT
jgi:hypothetical protein